MIVISFRSSRFGFLIFGRKDEYVDRHSQMFDIFSKKIGNGR